MKIVLEVGMMYQPKFNKAIGIIEDVSEKTGSAVHTVKIGWIQSSDGDLYSTKKIATYPVDSIADAVFDGKAHLFHPDKMNPNLAFSMKRRKS